MVGAAAAGSLWQIVLSLLFVGPLLPPSWRDY